MRFISSASFVMYVLYLDEAGNHAEAKYLTLAGLAVFEREIHWFAQDVDVLQKKYFPDVNESIEFHSSPLRAPESQHIAEPFNRLSRQERYSLLDDMYQIIHNRRGILFACAIEKAWCTDEDPYERAFEDLTSRFDLFLSRQNNQNTEYEHRGIIALAESSYRRNLESLGEKFRGGGTRWGQLHNIADVPFFLPARNTRLLQLADFCANAIYGRYNNGYARCFDIISLKFDREHGRIHGLCHLTRNYDCQCMACLHREPQMFQE